MAWTSFYITNIQYIYLFKNARRVAIPFYKLLFENYTKYTLFSDLITSLVNRF